MDLEHGTVGAEKGRPAAAGEAKSVTADGLPSFVMRYVPPTPACGFRRDETAGNVSVITGGYWMGETPVTTELFEAVFAEHENKFTDAVPGEAETPSRLPVERVTWYEAVAFCNKLSIKNGRTPAFCVRWKGAEMSTDDWTNLRYTDINEIVPSDWSVSLVPGADGFRLPTEMEWMWAAMGATNGGADVASVGYRKGYAGSVEGSDTANVGDYVWYEDNADGKTHQVGLKKPNELGLFDMSGNVWEWCRDFFVDYPSGVLSDYAGEATDGPRAMRGGSCFCELSFVDWQEIEHHYVSVSNRGSGGPMVYIPDAGLRVVC